MLWILIGYMYLFIHRPFEIWPVLGDFHLERAYMGFAMVAVLVYSGKKWIPNKLHLAYLVFAASVFFCWLSSPWASPAQEVVENYFKVVVFYVLFMVVVHDEKSLRRLLLAFLVIMFIYMAHSVREYFDGRHTFRMGIARMIGVDKSMGDPNTFGGSIVYALPFVVPFWLCSPTKGMKWFLAAYLALSFVCIGLTGSRSSFVGLLLWAVLTVFRSRRRFSMAILAFLATPLLWAALPPSMQNRFETIIHPEVGPANAVVSGQDRIEGFKIGMELWGQHPLIGVGPGAWRPATKRALESHNLYGQLLGEMGTLGGISFLALLLCFWSNLRWIRKTYKQHPEWKPDFLYHVAGAAGLGIVLLLFEGNFGHNLFRYNWLWYGGFVIIARYCVQQRLSNSPAWSASAPAFSFGSGGWGMARSYSA